jgi:hypothetical protein
MATLNFFNPATLLPSPEVAVKPPPQNIGGSFLISEALKETTQLVKAKRDVDSLKAEANAYADYVQDQSPELANLLRNKSSQYRIGMDTNEERSGFLKGVIGLSRLEQQDRKLELTAQKNDRFNNTGSKLNNLRGLLEIQTRRELEWNQEEARAEREHKANAQLLASKGLPYPPPYVKKPNPYTARVTELSNELESTISDTDSYASKSGGQAGFTPLPGVGGGLFPESEALTPATPGSDVGQDGATVNNLPVTDGSPINPLVGAPPPPTEGTYALPNPSAGAAPPKAEIVPESSTSQLTESPPVFNPSGMNQGGKSLIIDPNAVNPPVEKTPGVTKSIVPEATPSTTVPKAVSPADVNDPNYPILQQAIAAKEALKQSAITDIKSAFDNIDAQKDAIRDKSQLARLRELRDQAEKEIIAVNRSNPDLKSLVGAITKRYRESVRSVVPMTGAQVDAAKVKEGDQVVTYQVAGTTDGKGGDTLDLVERVEVDAATGKARTKIYKFETSGKETDVTDKVNEELLIRIGPSANSNPTTSGTIPSSPTAAFRPMSDFFKQ